ncbi:hypothetical protein NM688_g954 [Phlebia brevispora]|uniref:Uncharacterized protein n=1 Tax=Phlebia brevispora TaxID=194682 RepID=A0ACC1TD83_9APHY|nr:hypothetical protein NM688_g954 [Phlebia brevispora]
MPTSVPDAQRARTTSDLEARRQHNATLPVSRLPAETLLQVFQHCLPKLFPPPRPQRTLTQPFKPPPEPQNVPIRLSHVCSHWRVVVLSAPMLWKQLYVGEHISLEVLEELLRRSKVAPLRLEINLCETPHGAKVFQRVLEELQRLHTFDMHATDLILPWLGRPASHIEALSLQNHDRPVSMLSPNMASFAKTLDINFPSLKRLHVLEHNFDFVNWILPSTLTHLSARSWSPGDGSFSDVLRVLRALPQLQELALYNILPIINHPEAADTSLQPVSLPLLRTLILHDWMGAPLNLLGYIRLPPRTVPALTLDMYSYEDIPDVDTIHQLVSEDLQLRTIAIVFDEECFDNQRSFAFRAWKKSFFLQEFPRERLHADESDVNFSLTVDWYIPQDTSMEKLKDLVLNLPISHAQTLYYACEDRGAPAFQAGSLFSKMSSLHTLWIVGPDEGADFKLTPCLQWLLNEEPTFPALRLMCLESVDFGSGFFPRFCKALLKRQRTARLEKLVIRDSHNLLPPDVFALQEVICVEWEVSGPPDSVSRKQT